MFRGEEELSRRKKISKVKTERTLDEGFQIYVVNKLIIYKCVITTYVRIYQTDISDRLISDMMIQRSKDLK